MFEIPRTLTNALPAAVLAVAATAMLSIGVAREPGAPTASAQADEPPAARCPADLACTYAEVVNPYIAYRFQLERTCGANCSQRYWVTEAASGRVLLATPPTRHGEMALVDRGDQDPYPPVRTLLPDYGPSDAMCCPSRYLDVTYTWDPARGVLVADPPTIVPPEELDEALVTLDSPPYSRVFGRL